MVSPLTPEQLECVAVHEAGHAVMAWLFGKAIYRATVVPHEEEDIDGRMLVFAGHVLRSEKRTVRHRYHRDLAARGSAERDVMISMAGPVAEGLYLGRYVPPAGVDRKRIYDDAKNHHGGWTWGGLDNAVDADFDQLRRECHRTHLAWLSARTKIHLIAYWPLVDAVATALIEKGTLTGRELRRVIRTAYERVHAELYPNGMQLSPRYRPHVEP